MTAERIEFRCPHCRRAYSLRLDADKLARLDRIAVCGRCRKPFSLAQRVKEANSEPPAAKPPMSERDLRAAIVAKREREKRRREQAAKRTRQQRRAQTSSPPARVRSSNPPRPAQGKRRWGSESTARAEPRRPQPIPANPRADVFDTGYERVVSRQRTQPPPGVTTPTASTIPPAVTEPPPSLGTPQSEPPQGRRRRTTSPGLGSVQETDPPPRTTPVPISAPRREALTPDTLPLGMVEDDAKEESNEEEASSLPIPPTDIDFDTDDDEDEDAGDRPTLLLPEEVPSAPAPDPAAPSARNASARVVMSRNDWIKAADPGLLSVKNKPTDDVAALVALLDLART